MSRLEFVSAAGLRVDGRRPHEVRRIRCRMGLFARVDGSAYFEQGNTKAIAVVYGPRQAPFRSRSQHDRAVINCEYSLAPFSTSERRKRRAGDRRSLEITLAIKQAFETAIQTHLYPRSQIDIFVQVIQSDGDGLCPCLNAATLALVNAGVAMKDFVVACSAGYLERTPLLDLNYVETSSTGPLMPVALMPRSDKVTLVQMDSRLPMDAFEAVFDLAIQGCRQIDEYLRAHVREHTQRKLLARMHGTSRLTASMGDGATFSLAPSAEAAAAAEAEAATEAEEAAEEASRK